jgi:hypothetical protein
MICKVRVEHREFVGAMVSSGSFTDVWFVELLHDIEVAESFFVVQNLWGNLDLYLLSFPVV